MEDDFKLTSSQYSIIVLAFFISYLVFEVPANMILTRVRPSVFLPGLGLIWGTFAALMGATNNWSQLAGMRFLLGFAEVRFILISRMLHLAYFFPSGWLRSWLRLLPVLLV
jgi:fucose permease